MKFIMKQQDFARLMVQKWKSVAVESTFLNHEIIEKSLKLFRLHPFVVSPFFVLLIVLETVCCMIMIGPVRMILMMMMIEMKVSVMRLRPRAVVECDNMRGSQNISSITFRGFEGWW